MIMNIDIEPMGKLALALPRSSELLKQVGALRAKMATWESEFATASDTLNGFSDTSDVSHEQISSEIYVHLQVLQAQNWGQMEDLEKTLLKVAHEEAQRRERQHQSYRAASLCSLRDWLAVGTGRYCLRGSRAQARALMVGIFWVVDVKLILDASPLIEAEPYGECLGHRRSHVRYWTELQRSGVVKPELEYDEFPRGRVIFNKRSQQFLLLADGCILKDKSNLAKIEKTMHLPTDIVVDTDLHYRCPNCLRGHNPIDDLPNPLGTARPVRICSVRRLRKVKLRSFYRCVSSER